MYGLVRSSFSASRYSLRAFSKSPLASYATARLLCACASPGLISMARSKRNMASRQRFIRAICTPKLSWAAGRVRSAWCEQPSARPSAAIRIERRSIPFIVDLPPRTLPDSLRRLPLSARRPTRIAPSRGPNTHMPEVPLRDRLIAYALLPLPPSRIRLLIETFDPLSKMCSASPAMLRQLLSIDGPAGGEPWRNDELRRKIDEVRGSTVTLADDDYPPILRQLVDPPLALFYRGNPALGSRQSIAIVGSRK